MLLADHCVTDLARAIRHLPRALCVVIGLGASGWADDGSPEPDSSPPRPGGWTTDPDAVCPSGLTKVLAIGSSTLGAPLGTLLGNAITAAGLGWHRLAASSSGLARPDFWDWESNAKRLVAEHDPDVVIVQLGSNDFQPLMVPLGHRLWRPIRRSKTEWAEVYGARIDALLRIIGGQRERLIIWIGPYAFWGDNASEQGPIIDQLLRERISTWVAKGGFARYVNVWRETWDDRRGPVMRRQLPGARGRVEIRANDHIHLNLLAVRALLSDPVVAHVRQCGENSRMARARGETPM